MLLLYIKLFEKTKRSLELVSLPQFPHDFRRKIFIMLYFINWPNFIAWLPLLLAILDNMCIVIVCWPFCDVKKFEIYLNLKFLIRLSFYITKKLGQKCKYLKNGRGFFQKFSQTRRWTFKASRTICLHEHNMLFCLWVT